MKQCPRCASEITQFDKVCPRCGMVIEENSSKNRRKLNKLEKKEERKRRKEQKRQEKLEKESLKTDFEKYLKTDLMTKKEADNALSFDVNEDGEYHIDTEDVEIINKETRELLAKQDKQTYSIKKARGEYVPEKIEWWELYKLANRAFARRKIKKEVNKAAKIKPDYISKSKLLILALFLGWFGAHNFYAKNKRKAWWSLVCTIIWFSVVTFLPIYPIFKKIESIGAIAGLIAVTMSLSDVINIIFNNFKYKKQKLQFISKLSVETRAKLGAKYIDMELLQKPWWIRFRIWLNKKRTGFAEYRQERRQRLIEKEKAKQKAIEEQAKIDADIAAFEEKENQKLKEEKYKKTIDQALVQDIKDAIGENETEEDKKPYVKKKTAKVKVSSNKTKKK